MQSDKNNNVSYFCIIATSWISCVSVSSCLSLSLFVHPHREIFAVPPTHPSLVNPIPCYSHSILSLYGAVLQLPADIWLLLLLRHPQCPAGSVPRGKWESQESVSNDFSISTGHCTVWVTRQFVIVCVLLDRIWHVLMRQWSMGQWTVWRDWGWALSSTTFSMPSMLGRKETHTVLHFNWAARVLIREQPPHVFLLSYQQECSGGDSCRIPDRQIRKPL